MTTTSFTRRQALQATLAGGLAPLIAAPLAAPWVSRIASAQSLKKVNIITTSGNLTWEEVLKQKGYMEEFGITAETIHVADASKITGPLLTGEADIAIATGFSQLFPAIEKGAKIKILAGGIILGQQTIYSKKPEIKTVKDLVGKTIGVGSLGAQLHQIMVALLIKKGIDPASVTFANVGSSQDIFKAVVAGAVDAGPSTIDFFEQQDKYGVHSLTDGNFWEQLPEYAFQGSYASTEAVEKKRDLLVRTLAAYCKLYRYISAPESHDVFVKARGIALSKTDPASVAEADFQWRFFQKYQIFATDLVLSEKQISYQQELNRRFDVQKTILPYDQVTDMSIARDAVAMVTKA
jgi:ABC-type nitrate/sulfonate/bicarbonate transport system substrate-binding protein